jgi:hypothetical protein
MINERRGLIPGVIQQLRKQLCNAWSSLAVVRGFTAEAAMRARGALRRVIWRQRASLDSFQSEPSISLELLQNTAFPFASDAALQYLKVSASPMHRWARRLNDCLFL